MLHLQVYAQIYTNFPDQPGLASSQLCKKQGDTSLTHVLWKTAIKQTI